MSPKRRISRFAQILVWSSALLGLAPIGWSQGRVSNGEVRERNLSELAAVVEATPRDYEAMPIGRTNPFAAVRRVNNAAPMVREQSDGPVETAPVNQPTRPARLSDPVALTAIARNFRPSGSIIVGERRLLRLRDGTMINEGSSFNARIAGEAYTVKVISVTRDGYEIGLGEARTSARFLDGSAGQVASPADPPAEPPLSENAGEGDN
jgi:hypothetical protein